VSPVILLDSGPLGLVTNPRATRENQDGLRWLRAQINAGNRVIVPEITDYEVRRELLRINRVRGIERFETLIATTGYLPITTDAMRRAAELWAQARQRGMPTADRHALDGDVILAAQALTLDAGGEPVVIATMNVGHLAQFVDARDWREIG
jgi:predicted nucleic acid-binding protein